MLSNALQYECYPEEFEKQVKKAYGEEEFKRFMKMLPSFNAKYQTWYSESRSLIKLLLPDRVSDFVKQYEKPKTARKSIDFENYVIEDCLQGLSVTKGWEKERVVGPEAAIPRFTQQLNILKATQKRFESSLFDIKQLVQADLFDSELGAAKELSNNKFYRAAGALAGVVLEKHLGQVCENHSLTLSKKKPTINDFNELIKQNDIIDIPQWRFIQHLADIRNLCDHNKKTEPTETDIVDMISGVDKITKTVF
ncbi:hypothetical protein EV199_3564 [Pseudobacter ginsenosidimutans]|uniref:DUF4145 domain-containing protein n=2 Tax=Pseudobacter ginsenosidimutans TaxID=661488 RepID=A0A4Q7MS84_9BACT|nr:hypothetical protein FSB84_07550 [Pseudobacter ginsenosidimutans]RZS71656.1 hypothetical protein EV199_3564 [Pseudobacter ginsenosidimutans]